MQTLDWETPMSVTIDQMNVEVKKLLELEAVLEEKKKVYKDADDAYEQHRNRLMNILMESGQGKFHSLYGTISLAIKKQVQVPKNPSDKKLMLEYFESLGDELYNSYVSVNSMTLNSYFKQQVEMDPDFTMPGITGVTEKPELRFRKEK
jgi:prophage DNA circulation protein